MAATSATDRLGGVKHLVVLMMENRSFDHMLGYLQLAGMDVEGLAGAQPNPDPAGGAISVFEFPEDFTAFHAPGKPLDESLDPCHAPDCVAEQLADGNRGFVKNFVDRKQPVPEHRGLPMGYFTGKHLPVYDYLAHTFCVCDAWHSSVPGDTAPNRLYSVTGQEGEPVTEQLDIFKPFIGSANWDKLKNIPIFDLPAFTRHLDDRQWRWYSYDPASLRSMDSLYRQPFHLHRDNFAYFDRKSVTLEMELAEALLVTGSFLDDAANGQLRDVSWIDPNFIDLRIFDSNGDDDHPPSDVHAGQAFILDLFEALVNAPQWQDTVLVITYDEHGGFYDHVVPPPVPDGDGGKYATYGVRVPALVIGPRVQQGVCKTLFDHGSLIKTALRRFAAKPDEAIAAMPNRVHTAKNIGYCLLDEPRTDVGPEQLAAPIADLHAKIAAWKTAAVQSHRAQPRARSLSPEGAGHPLVLHDFQKDHLRTALTLRKMGLPAGQP